MGEWRTTQTRDCSQFAPEHNGNRTPGRDPDGRGPLDRQEPESNRV